MSTHYNFLIHFGEIMGIVNFVFNVLIGTCVLIYNDDKIFFLTSNFIKSNIVLTILLIYLLNLQNNIKKKITTDDKFLQFFILYLSM